MTLDEKQMKLKAYCENFDGECVDCPLEEIVKQPDGSHDFCYSDGANIERNYAALFGADEDTADMVNHPSHYETGRFECIDVMVETQGVEAVKDFCICNAFKYLYRHKNKNGNEDVKKAIWYLNKFMELEGEQHDQD